MVLLLRPRCLSRYIGCIGSLLLYEFTHKPAFVASAAFLTTKNNQPSATSSSRSNNSSSSSLKLQNIFDMLMRGGGGSGDLPSGMKRVPTQFIAALGDPQANSANTGAEQWGIWRIDPGPRGVHISQYDTQFTAGSRQAPAGWSLDPKDFWIEEYGRIMEKPDFPVPPGRYLVTGAREVTTILTVGEPNKADGNTQPWKLEDGAKLFDVTHLPCRSARYTTSSSSSSDVVTPGDANPNDYPVRPGAEMPPIQGCNKQDYAVIFVLAVDE